MKLSWGDILYFLTGILTLEKKKSSRENLISPRKKRKILSLLKKSPQEKKHLESFLQKHKDLLWEKESITLSPSLSQIERNLIYTLRSLEEAPTPPTTSTYKLPYALSFSFSFLGAIFFGGYLIKKTLPPKEALYVGKKYFPPTSLTLHTKENPQKVFYIAYGKVLGVMEVAPQSKVQIQIQKKEKKPYILLSIFKGKAQIQAFSYRILSPSSSEKDQQEEKPFYPSQSPSSKKPGKEKSLRKEKNQMHPSSLKRKTLEKGHRYKKHRYKEHRYKERYEHIREKIRHQEKTKHKNIMEKERKWRSPSMPYGGGHP